MGQDILLTQPALRMAPWLEALQQAGHRVWHWPLSTLELEPSIHLRHLHTRIRASDWVFLPSPGAVTLLMQALAGAELPWPEGSRLGLIGPGSAQALAEWTPRLRGLAQARWRVPQHPPFDAKALLALPDFSEAGPQRVLVLHRADGSTAWLRDLLCRGIRLEVHALYRQIAVPLPQVASQFLRNAMQQARPVCVSVASRGAGSALMGAAESLGAGAWLSEQPVFTQHTAIARALQVQGFRRIIVHNPGVHAFMVALRTVESARPASL